MRLVVAGFDLACWACRNCPTFREGEAAVGDQFVGFYWTLPALWAEFRDIPDDPIEAARKSKTIRYQREYAHQHVNACGGKIIAEYAYIDNSPDRGTEFILPKVNEAIAHCRKNDAILLYIDFSDAYYWRPQHFLNEALAAYADREPLEPRPIQMGGSIFCPIEHFRRWRRLDKSEPTKRHRAALEALKVAAAKYAHLHRRHKLISDELNAKGVLPPRAAKWTPASVCKTLERYSMAFADEQVLKPNSLVDLGDMRL